MVAGHLFYYPSDLYFQGLKKLKTAALVYFLLLLPNIKKRGLSSSELEILECGQHLSGPGGTAMVPCITTVELCVQE